MITAIIPLFFFQKKMFFVGDFGYDFWIVGSIVALWSVLLHLGIFSNMFKRNNVKLISRPTELRDHNSDRENKQSNLQVIKFSAHFDTTIIIISTVLLHPFLLPEG